MTWTIEAKLLPLVGVAGHLYFEIFDDAGARVLQINGFATNRATQQPRSIGLPGDSLKAYISNDQILSETAGATRNHHPHKGQVIFAGTQKDILKAVMAAEEAATKINALDLGYQLLTQNSNSVFMHIFEAIAAAVPVDFKALQMVRRVKPLLPGINKQILGQGGYRSLKKRFNQESAKKMQRLNKKIPPPQP